MTQITTEDLENPPAYSTDAMEKILRVIERENAKFQAGRGDISKLATAQLLYISVLTRAPKSPVLRLLVVNVFDIFQGGGNVRLREGGRPLSFMAWPIWLVKIVHKDLNESIIFHEAAYSLPGREAQPNEHHFAN